MLRATRVSWAAAAPPKERLEVAPQDHAPRPVRSRGRRYLTASTTLNSCSIWYGPIQDPTVVRGSPYFHTIGGAQVSCPTRGHKISITVVEWMYNGTSWYQMGSTASLTLSSSAGFQAETYVGCPGHYGY